MGSAPILSVEGFQYYVVSIDDFSRYCWFYPFKRKSRFFRYLVFQKMVEKQLGKKINHFYLSVKYFINCRAAEQNSVAERKHRHVVELGLDMMHEALSTKTFLGRSILYCQLSH